MARQAVLQEQEAATREALARGNDRKRPFDEADGGQDSSGDYKVLPCGSSTQCPSCRATLLSTLDLCIEAPSTPPHPSSLQETPGSIPARAEQLAV